MTCPTTVPGTGCGYCFPRSNFKFLNLRGVRSRGVLAPFQLLVDRKHRCGCFLAGDSLGQCRLCNCHPKIGLHSTRSVWRCTGNAIRDQLRQSNTAVHREAKRHHPKHGQHQHHHQRNHRGRRWLWLFHSLTRFDPYPQPERHFSSLVPSANQRLRFRTGIHPQLEPRDSGQHLCFWNGCDLHFSFTHAHSGTAYCLSVMGHELQFRRRLSCLPRQRHRLIASFPRNSQSHLYRFDCSFRWHLPLCCHRG